MDEEKKEEFSIPEPEYVKPLQEPIPVQPRSEHEPEPLPEVNVPTMGTVEKEMYYVRAALNEQQKRVLDAYIQTIMKRISNTKRKSFVVGVVIGGLVGMAGLLLSIWLYINFFI